MKEKKEKKPETEWNKSRVLFGFLFLLILIALGIFANRSYFEKINSSKPVINAKPPDVKKAVQDRINEIQREAQKIKPADVATSSPQVQKLIKDLNSLQNLPASEAKSACEKICSGL